MKCPVCKDVVLEEHELEADLPSWQCRECNGHWLEGERYHSWLEKQPREGHTTQAAVDLPVRESEAAKLCPKCGRFLGRFNVGHGLEFRLDRCGHCGGIWFDANEWETLKARGLHERVHFVFSAAWQAEFVRQEHDKTMEKLLIERLGEGDLAEVRRIKAWIEGHPRRAELYAFLIQREAV
jgi:Zn-finger nucleic acid-binding protein